MHDGLAHFLHYSGSLVEVRCTACMWSSVLLGLKRVLALACARPTHCPSVPPPQTASRRCGRLSAAHPNGWASTLRWVWVGWAGSCGCCLPWDGAAQLLALPAATHSPPDFVCHPASAAAQVPNPHRGGGDACGVVEPKSLCGCCAQGKDGRAGQQAGSPRFG